MDHARGCTHPTTYCVKQRPNKVGAFTHDSVSLLKASGPPIATINRRLKVHAARLPRLGLRSPGPSATRSGCRCERSGSRVAAAHLARRPALLPRACTCKGWMATLRSSKSPGTRLPAVATGGRGHLPRRRNRGRRRTRQGGLRTRRGIPPHRSTQHETWQSRGDTRVPMCLAADISPQRPARKIRHESQAIMQRRERVIHYTQQGAKCESPQKAQSASSPQA